MHSEGGPPRPAARSRQAKGAPSRSPTAHTSHAAAAHAPWGRVAGPVHAQRVHVRGILRAVDYEVSTPVPGSVVEALSHARLPFEPQGRLVDFRRDLVRGRLSDIENILSYNLGTGALRAAAAHGLILERSFAASPAAPHHYRYELVADPWPWRCWRTTELLAGITLDAPLSLFTEPKAGRWWLAARRGDIATRSTRSRPPAAYALSITVSPPAGWRGSLSELIKPLTDGIVSALHSHAGPVDRIVDRASSIDPTLTAGELTALLAQSRPAPLGAVRLVTPRAAGVQWLPADDGIVALDVRMAAGAGVGTVEARAHLVGQLAPEGIRNPTF